MKAGSLKWSCVILQMIYNEQADLSEVLDVSTCTVYRYLNISREVGYEIEFNKEAKSYKIVNSENVVLSYIIQVLKQG